LSSIREPFLHEPYIREPVHNVELFASIQLLFKQEYLSSFDFMVREQVVINSL